MDSMGKSDESRMVRTRAFSRVKRIPLPLFLVIILATGVVIAGVVVLVVLPDFSTSAHPMIQISLQHPNATIQQNGSVSTTVTITSLNGASGNASLSASLVSVCRGCLPVGTVVNPQSVLLLPNTSHNVNLTVSAAAFTNPITYNVTFTASLCCSTNYHLSKYYAVTVVYAPESISLASYQFNSNTTATLNITNHLGVDDQLSYYQITNATGYDVYNSDYNCYFAGYCSGPILTANATTLIILNTYGGLLFRPGQTYTLTYTTTRNNSFPMMITR